MASHDRSRLILGLGYLFCLPFGLAAAPTQVLFDGRSPDAGGRVAATDARFVSVGEIPYDALVNASRSVGDGMYAARSKAPRLHATLREPKP